VGRILLATEIRGAQKYWHIKDSTKIYLSPFKENKVVGILWEDGSAFGTWFSGDPQDIHLIEMLPFSPISEQLLSEDWISEQFPVLEKTKTSGWDDLIAANQAIIQPAQAWASALTVTFGSGTTLPDTLYWIATRPSNGPGIPCNKTYPPSTCVDTCCPNHLAVESAGLSDGNYAYIKQDYRVVLKNPNRGFNLAVLTQGSHRVVSTGTFDTYGDETATANLVAFVNGIAMGNIVLVGIQDSVAPLDNVVLAALTTIGAQQAKSISDGSSYALIGIKGGPALAESSLASGKGAAYASHQFAC